MATVDLKFIKKRRNELDMSLQRVANELGFKNASTYLKYENGDYSFRADMLPKLSLILKCDLQNFFTK